MNDYDRKLLQLARLQIMHAQALLGSKQEEDADESLEAACQAICTVLKNTENKNVN